MFKLALNRYDMFKLALDRFRLALKWDDLFIFVSCILYMFRLALYMYDMFQTWFGMFRLALYIHDMFRRGLICYIDLWVNYSIVCSLGP